MISFNLIENAKDFLEHAFEHLTPDDNKIKSSDYKQAILDLYHTAELILKERLQRELPAFIWEKVEEYPSLDSKTIGIEKSIKRLKNIAQVKIEKEDQDTLFKCKKIRNAIIHHKIEINRKEAKIIIGKILSFVFSFSKCHLEIDFVDEFQRFDEDRWSELIELYEFAQEYSKKLEKQLTDKGKILIGCPNCGEQTLDIITEQCALCGHYGNIDEIDN